ncbi:hypothetical protein SCOCK_220063 [Actinacidiphila cocklensis]|uniref:Uncharacterized protein n=1 Tax=Actinacidiphila cocklensis TaxID=887465 RepID=A0A9W4DPS7_9ACTN|nr:hypothetical protein SCOCK_220063 [Actinacidiphila cocklensis]
MTAPRRARLASPSPPSGDRNPSHRISSHSGNATETESVVPPVRLAARCPRDAHHRLSREWRHYAT